MDKPVVSFARKQVIDPSVTVYRTARFVSRQRVYERVIDLLNRATKDQGRRKVSRTLTKTARRGLEKLVEELDGPDPALRLLGVVEWYEAHCLDKYVPWVEGAESLREKFGRLEKQMLLHGQENKTTSVDDVAAGLFNGNRILSLAFRSNILPKAKGIDLGDVAEPVLAERLGALYGELRAARTPNSENGPMDLLDRYLDWLAEHRDWRATVRVLSTTSPAFGQWRREEASRHPRGADPLTGR
jgi:hypothetical protein